MNQLLRSFTIRTRMRGAIAVVLLMFALLSAAAFLGGLQLKSLNTDFSTHSLAEASILGKLNKSLGELRRHEKNMVIDYEDGAAVASHQPLWTQAVNDIRTELGDLLHGEEDEDNPLARAALQALEAYVKATEPVMKTLVERRLRHRQGRRQAPGRGQGPHHPGGSEDQCHRQGGGRRGERGPGSLRPHDAAHALRLLRGAGDGGADRGAHHPGQLAVHRRPDRGGSQHCPGHRRRRPEPTDHRQGQ